MTITVELPDELAVRLSTVPADELNQFAVSAFADLIQEREKGTPILLLDGTGGDLTVAAGNVAVAPGVLYRRPLETPDWVRAMTPANPATDGTNGMHRVFGAFGDMGMTDEQFTEALERLS